MEFLEQVQEAVRALTALEVMAVFAGIVYVVLAAQENIWCWFWGIINSLLSIYLFYTAQLYAESVLYIYYVLAGIYGWYAWSPKNQSQETQQLSISTWRIRQHFQTILSGVVLSYLLAIFLQQFTDARLPLIDSFTTVFSFIATYMTTRKILENWIYWIIVDIVTTGMYFSREINLYALLMIVYTIIAILGFIKWRKVWLLSLEKESQRA